VELPDGEIGFRVHERLPDSLKGFDDDAVCVSFARRL
jgi:hypothetical protein